MADILGLGLTHFGGFMFSDAEMGSRITAALNGQKLPADLKNPANWPARMREEWGSDQGATFAAIDEAIARKPKGHDFIIDRRHKRPALARHMSVTGG